MKVTRSFIGQFTAAFSMTAARLAAQKRTGIGRVVALAPSSLRSAGMLRQLATSSGAYALASAASPIVSLVLVPYLAHHLSQTDYGILTILNTTISVIAFVTQLGLTSAFLRAYNHDYSSQHDQHAVLSTSLVLLVLVSLPSFLAIAAMAPVIANILFQRTSQSYLVTLAGGVVLASNLTVPGLSWMRAESRGILFSSLSVGSAVVTLAANLILVGRFQLGVAGALIATGCGFTTMAVCTVPVILVHAGIRVRRDVARNLLTFGLPQVPGLVSGWILQLSDRYLLTLFGSLAQVASYSVGYSLGWYAVSIVVVTPFTLAWPPVMYAIARRSNACDVFRLAFRWFSIALLFVALTFSLVSSAVIRALFPPSYSAAASLAPVIALSCVFFGAYNVFMTGSYVQRKPWLVAVFITLAAALNVLLNLILISRFGAMGAAVSTLIAYMGLALLAYVGNQRIYPIDFEIGRFLSVTMIGIGMYLARLAWIHVIGAGGSWAISLSALVIYGCVLWLLWGSRSEAAVVT